MMADSCVFDKKNYDIVYGDDHYTIDYRAQGCEKLKKLKIAIRSIMIKNKDIMSPI